MSCFRNRQNSNTQGQMSATPTLQAWGCLVCCVGFFAEPLKRIQVQSCAYCVYKKA